MREHDPERYLATLFTPADVREALFALYAFDHEIARVRRVVSQPIAGLVRLQWWREALDAIAADQRPAHPVVEAVHARWDRFAPLRPRLDTAIDAREQELHASGSIQMPLPSGAAVRQRVGHTPLHAGKPCVAEARLGRQ